jgi:hypothetical protein
MSSLIDEAKALEEALDNNEFVNSDLLNDFAKRARLYAHTVTPEAHSSVLEAFNNLILAVARHQSRTQEKIKTIRTNRRSLKKFGHLRPNTRGQRLHNSF